MKLRPMETISPIELVRHSVWEFDEESEADDDTCIRPVGSLPVTSLDGRIVATEVSLNGGASVLASLSNVSLTDSKRNRHFLALTVYGKNAETFHLARYHDPDFDSSGPAALAEFLGLPLGDVFPISYDLSKIALGVADCVAGSIASEASVQLSPIELIGLALGDV